MVAFNSSSLVAQGAVVGDLKSTRGRTVSVLAVLAASLASFTGSTNGNGVAVANGSATATFAANQTLPAGTPLVFASQPNVVYYTASVLTSGTAATLTTPYTGVTNASTNATNIMSATFTTAAGGQYTFTDTTAQTLPIGFQFQVSAPTPLSPIKTYTTTAAVTTDVMTVSTGVVPTTPITTNGTLVTLIATNGNMGVLTLVQPVQNSSTDSTVPPVKRIVSGSGEAAVITFTPWGNITATKFVLVTALGNEHQFVGADNQPVQCVSLPASSLVV
jgi:hypothetical protein